MRVYSLAQAKDYYATYYAPGNLTGAVVGNFELDEAKADAEAILSKPLVTPQTTAEGVTVHKLLIASGVDIEKEYYLAVATDRALPASRGFVLDRT